MRLWASSRAERQHGQIIVEVLLVLPVFLWLVFMIMEIGHLAFRTILLHHAAYEVARYGSLTVPNQRMPKKGGCEAPNPDRAAMESIAHRILPRNLDVDVRAVPTMPFDRQAMCQNFDIIVTLKQDVPMIFPMTGMFLADRRRRTRKLVAAVPMPVEMPLFQ